MITREQLIQKYKQFFESKNHRWISSASLVPENDPTVLFTTAGMHPLVPYLMGENHPEGKRIANVQKCIRTDDINEVGDATHQTFFEMLGNWSFGDYFKPEAIVWSYEFLTDSKWLGLNRDKLAVTVFAGDTDAPFDQEAYDLWIKTGIKPERIARLPKSDNWWGPAGQTGPCGPDTEIFYWVGTEVAPEKFDPKDKRWVEIWNNVFMQYNRRKRVILADGIDCLISKDLEVNMEMAKLLQNYQTQVIVVTNFERSKIEKIVESLGFSLFTLEHKIEKSDKKYFESLLQEYNLMVNDVVYFEHKQSSLDGGVAAGIKSALYTDNESLDLFIKDNLFYYSPLAQKNVDTGMGLARTLAVLNGLSDNYQTEIFAPIIEKIEQISGKKYEDDETSFRVVADHITAAVFAVADNALPSNKGAGYITRRLIRRAISKLHALGIDQPRIKELALSVIQIYSYTYHSLTSPAILDTIEGEEKKFLDTLSVGLKQVERCENPDGKFAFNLFQTYGFPVEMTIENLHQQKINFDQDKLLQEFNQEMLAHQDLSRTASAGMFKGGLSDASEVTTKYHTATHLLQAALRQVLGKEVYQRGSNITAERMRFDFSYPEKMTPEQIIKVESLVNGWVKDSLDVKMEETSLSEAKQSGALGVFEDKYGSKVKVYSVGNVSKEICGGPHVSNTSELGTFKIVKEEASSAGVRRIKATLGD